MSGPSKGPLWGTTALAPTSASGGPLIEVRRYRGSQRTAYATFEADARLMAEAGWFPTTQSYVPGTWGCGAWILAFILLIFVIGIIVLAYMIVVRPDGELVVTYEYRGRVPSPASSEGLATAPEVSGAAAVGAAAQAAAGADVAATAPHVTAGAAAPASSDPVERLRKLGEMRDAGLITPDEFEAKKAEILGRM